MIKRKKNLLYAFFLCVLAFGMMNCGSAKRIALDPESSDFYDTAYLIMTGVEKNIFHHLPDADSRKEFIQDFWSKRDPDPDTDENEFKEEFFARIEYANQHFKGEGPPGWKTDRGRIYIYLGPPDRTDETFTDPQTGRALQGSWLVWVYYRYNLGVIFIDNGTGTFKINPMPYEMGGGILGSLTEAIEMAKLGVSFLESKRSVRYMDFDFQFDKEKREIVISLSVKSLEFIAEEGLLKADFSFDFHVYEKEGTKSDRFKREESFAEPEDNVLEMKNIVFRFPYNLNPGKYYVDVIIIEKGSMNKARKIYDVKV
ncbi:MAG: GWxTD domain-containing protein [Candidatus Aminicenantes bacterium]|nr:MAG: GWxTD domain-containing protein [Candidatus Aminicenantes bacterium]